MKVIEERKGLAFENGYATLNKKGLVLIGMSPGNSYFKKKIIDKLINFVSRRFFKVRIMIAEKPAEHTYKAMGYPEGKAKRKARLAGNNLRNHSERSIASLKKGDIAVIDWEKDVSSNSLYKEAYREMKELYKKNILFREDAREATGYVLEGRIKPSVNMNKAVEEGVHYLLKELAFLLASPSIFGVSHVAYIYHREWNVYERFVNGFYDGRPKEKLGFLIVK